MYGYKIKKKNIFNGFTETSMVGYGFADVDGAVDAGMLDIENLCDNSRNVTSDFKIVVFEEMNGVAIEGTEKEINCN